MMSKAAYYMQEHLRRNYALVTDIFHPNTFIVRGRLAFPQGLAAIRLFFPNKSPADVYAHPYFIEKQSDPSQPSPQLHITEECQGIMKVIKGLRYMKDDSSKLDSTMVLVTDYNVPAVGKILNLQKEGSSERVSPSASGTRDSDDDILKSSEVMNELLKTSPSSQLGAAENSELIKRVAERLTKNAMLRKLSKPNGPTSPHANATAQSLRGTDQSGLPTGFGKGARSTRLETAFFPGPEENPVGKPNNFDFFRTALGPRSANPGEGLRKVKANNTTDGEPDQGPQFETRVGGYTVLYNPTETSEATFVDIIDKLRREERVVKAIVVPTRQAWRNLQLWADVFPDAEIISSGAIPSPNADKSQAAAASSASPHGDPQVKAHGREGGCLDFGNGVTGLVFPEVELEDYSDEHKVASEASNYNSASRTLGGKVNAVAGNPTDYSNTDYSFGYSANVDQRKSIEEQVDDVLLSRQGAVYDAIKEAETVIYGLRNEDLARIRVLEKKQDHVALTPTIELIRIDGDDIANEYVLFDQNSGALACTDLFHGEYGDFDPVNTWMCRVWFKFMKGGNYKRVDCVPRYKMLQVLRSGVVENSDSHVKTNTGDPLERIRSSIDKLTRTRDINCIICSHGTPPVVGDPANALRVQWGMSPITENESNSTK